MKLKFPIILSLLLMSSVAISAELPKSSELPRMPDAYRNNDYKDLTKRNPYGMSIYDVAEREAEEDIFGSEVISLEESKRILSERRKQKAQKDAQSGGVSE